jgi:hypothetical protein
VTESHVGYSGKQIAHAVSLDTTMPTPSSPTRSTTSAHRAATAHRRREMHDVFIVISEGLGGGHLVRTVYAADHDDARQTHQENYADEPIVEVHQ